MVGRKNSAKIRIDQEGPTSDSGSERGKRKNTKFSVIII